MSNLEDKILSYVKQNGYIMISISGGSYLTSLKPHA